VESAPHSPRGRLLGRVHLGKAPVAALAVIRTRRERCQGSHILQVHWPPAPLATKGGARPRGGTLVTRPRPEHGCPQRSTPVSLQLTAHVTAVVALDVCFDPHRQSLPVLTVRFLRRRMAPACGASPPRLDGLAEGDHPGGETVPLPLFTTATSPRRMLRTTKRGWHLTVPPRWPKTRAIASDGPPWARTSDPALLRRSGWAAGCGYR
jgi:hypothetical protein